jgi:hypothetical protein
MDPVVVHIPRCVQNESESLELKALEDFDVGLEAFPIAEFHGPIWVSVLLCIVEPKICHLKVTITVFFVCLYPSVFHRYSRNTNEI